MRVAHVESGRHLYGGARQVLHLIEGLAARGVENVLVCAAGSAIASEAAGRCDVIELPLSGDVDPWAVRRLRRAFSAVRPNIVHVHSRRGADVYAGLASGGAPWRAVLSRRVDQREIAPWARLKYRPYAAIVAISRAVERELVEHVGLSPERVHVIPSAVPPRASDASSTASRTAARRELAAAVGLPPDASIAAVIGQLIPRKGHRVLLAALPDVLARHPRWHVVLFGRGPLEAQLRREIARAGLDRRVRIAGFRAELAAWLSGIDVVVHPALKEGLGLAVLEAMSAGVPVVASAAGGLLDVIEDGVSGLLVPAGDAEALQRAVERLFADPGERARLGDGGRRRVRDAFGVERMASAHLALYRRLVGSRQAASADPLDPAATRMPAADSARGPLR
ncbi:MAG TPA: glycosyltransferase family 4 protein [Gammaproteobacteria bacterium]